MPTPTRRRFIAGSSAVAASSLASPAASTGASAAAQLSVPANRRLSSGFPREKLAGLLIARESWKPFPTASDRAAWQALPEETRKALVQQGEAHLGTDWPALPATLFLQFRRDGNRSNYERVRNTRREQLRRLAMAECVEGKGRFLDDIANGLWTTCEETYWGVPAHIHVQKAGNDLPDAEEPTVDLFAAETSAQLAWTHYLLGPQLDTVSKLLNARLAHEIDRRMLTPCLNQRFWWTGVDPEDDRQLNNWTPWVVSNWIASTLLMERNPARRVAAIHKSLRSLDRFLDFYHEDGGCDEGPSYWGHAGGSLFDCLEWLHSASNGRVDFYRMPLVQEIGRYIYRAHIHDNWYINFADASARISIYGDLVYRYGRRIGDEKMQALGAHAASVHSGGAVLSGPLGRQLPALLNMKELAAAKRFQPLVRDVWMPGIQVMAARVKEGSAEGLYLAAQGGHNAESHNHNDVGNFIVYADGEPAIIDVGVETYTAKTFSSRRYEIWTMQSAYHNLPTIGGVMQSAGRQFAARNVSYNANAEAARFELDIAGAWPKEAGIESWKRTLTLQRAANRVEVRDGYSLSKTAPVITLTLMTPCKVQETASGELTLQDPKFRSGPVKVLFDAKTFKPAVEEIRIEDARLKGSWPTTIYRILLAAANPPPRADWLVQISQR